MHPFAKSLGKFFSNERERWILWLPVALGLGISLYFSMSFEPARWIGPAWLTAALILAAAWRREIAGWLPLLFVAAAALGFTLAVERAHRVAAPILERSTGFIALEARIAEVEPVESGERLVLDQLDLPPISGPVPTKVRLRMPKEATGFRAGQRVALRAMLLPPPMPAAPGGYDFARVAWFKGIGAVGFAINPVTVLDQGEPSPGWTEEVRLWIAHQRHTLTGRIIAASDRAGLDPGTGATAAALITAERGPVPEAVMQAYRDSGLAHILVIAGMHMSMVAGLVFVAIRGLLAAIPPIALRYPIKKWTAAAALAITAGYLVVSGAPVPTQRAFMMNGIFLLAVLLDREALSLRSITWAALAVLISQPEALVGASFQMSFAAVYALISGYEALGPRLGQWRRDHHGWLAEGGFYVLGILLTTQIAGSATALYTAYHFNRYALYSLLGNALAVPVVGFWVMPAALLGFVLLPFGLDGWGWVLMGHGIQTVTAIAQGVSGLPGAALDLPAMPVSAMIVFTLGGFWLLLWKGRWRLYGLTGMAAGLLLWGLHVPPDLMIDAGGKVAALRDADGRVWVSGRVGGKRARETWIKQAGQGDDAPLWEDWDSPDLGCDSLGCIWRRNGHVVALARYPDALEEDCRAADLVIVPQTVRMRCPSAQWLITRQDLRQGGGHVFWLEKGRPITGLSAAQWQGERLWSHPLPSYSVKSRQSSNIARTASPPVAPTPAPSQSDVDDDQAQPTPNPPRSEADGE